MIHHVFRRRKLKIESEPSQPQQKERKKEKVSDLAYTHNIFLPTFEILISFNIIKILGCIVLYLLKARKLFVGFCIYIVAVCLI